MSITAVASPADARYVPCWLSWVGATTGCLTALGVECDPAEVAGHSGYAFQLTVERSLCASGPTVFDWLSLLTGPARLGRSVSLFMAGECYTEKTKNDRLRKHCSAAFDAARHEIAAGRPCVIWGAYVPEFAVCTGITDDAYQVETIRRTLNEPQPPVKFDELNAPGGLYTLGFPTVTEPNRLQADRDSIAEACKLLKRSESHDNYAWGRAAYDLWAAALKENRAEAFGNSYNAQCWAEARRLGHAFVGRVAGRHVEKLNSATIDALRDAEAALERASAALEQVARLFPFPGNPDQFTASNRATAAEALEAAKAADDHAVMHLGFALAAWTQPRNGTGSTTQSTT